MSPVKESSPTNIDISKLFEDCIVDYLQYVTKLGARGGKNWNMPFRGFVKIMD